MDRTLRQGQAPFTVIMVNGEGAEVLHVAACDDDFDVNSDGSHISFIIDECNRNGRDMVFVYKGHIWLEEFANMIGSPFLFYRSPLVTMH